MVSLRRDEAVCRAAMITVRNYAVELDLTDDTTRFISRCRIGLTVHRAGETFVDVAPVRLRGVRLDGAALAVEQLDGARFPLRLGAGEAELEVEAEMAYRTDGEGLHRAVDPADGRSYTYAMSFLDAAPRVMACFDQPDLKAPLQLTVTCHPDWLVFANAPGEQVEPGRWSFEATPPLATYQFTVVAGPYHVVRGTAEVDGVSIPLSLSARRSLAAELDRQAEDILTVTRQSFVELHRLFGVRYPYGDYHQAFVPEFNAGAMENPGCVTLRDSMIFDSGITRGELVNRATTVAHELAHMWFGNLVTPRWWDDLWLNESFAEYLGHRVAAQATAYTDARIHEAFHRRNWGLAADSRPTTHPVAGGSAPDAATALADFDGISYAKGAALVAQLAITLGDEAFLAGLRRHIATHRFGNAAMADLVAAWESAAGTDLSGWVSDWLAAAGADRVRLDRAAASVVVRPASARRHPVTVAVHDEAGWSRYPVRANGSRTPLPEPAAAAVRAGAAVVLDSEVTSWAVSGLDPQTLAALVEILPGTGDPMLRAAIWTALRSSLHEAELDPAVALDLVLAALPAEQGSIAMETIGKWACTRLVPVCEDPPQALARLHEVVRAVMATTTGELRLAATRVGVESATAPHRLRGWLEASVIGDVAVDLDLRWRILHRLAALGEVDRDELDRRYRDEPSARAEIALAGCLAALPEDAAKAWAWRRFTGEVAASNYVVTAAGAGMHQWGQQEFTDPYLRPYFEVVASTAECRSGWALAEAAGSFFPRTTSNRTALQLADELAARPEVDRAVARVVLDQADDLRRRLAVADPSLLVTNDRREPLSPDQG
ncbi:MAG: aminopeptidase N [Kineosporiaceae bacterium]